MIVVALSLVMPVLGTGIHEFAWSGKALLNETRGWQDQALP
jgi:hypothetical protein